MKVSVLGLMAGTILAAAADFAAANEMYDAYFAKHGTVCYARSYDAAHLKQHPRQKVQRVELAFRNKKGTASAFELTLGLVAKDGAKRFAMPVYCSAQGNALLCKVEADGGTFRLEPAGRGALALQVVGDGLRMEGATGFIEVGGKFSDDNRFVLAPTDAKLCTARGR